jgi:hypothetical protein
LPTAALPHCQLRPSALKWTPAGPGTCVARSRAVTASISARARRISARPAVRPDRRVDELAHALGQRHEVRLQLVDLGRRQRAEPEAGEPLLGLGHVANRKS